jgi:hypothetical protein
MTAASKCRALRSFSGIATNGAYLRLLNPGQEISGIQDLDDPIGFLHLRFWVVRL